jgi:hypothetical protein
VPTVRAIPRVALAGRRVMQAVRRQLYNVHLLQRPLKTCAEGKKHDILSKLIFSEKVRCFYLGGTGMKSIVRTVRLVLVTFVALSGLLIAFLDTFGLLSGFVNAINNLPLILLSLIAIELVWERFETLNRVDKFLNKVEEEDTKLTEIKIVMDRVKGFIDNLDNISYIEKLTSVHSAFVNFEKRFSQVNAFFYVLERNEKFQYLALKYGLRRLTRIIDEETVQVRDYSETLETWRECILESKEWLASSYAKNAWGMGDGFSDKISFDYQRLRIETEGEICRVFIVDSKEEFEKLNTVMKKQADIGVSVKWVMREDLEKLPHVKRAQKELGTWDVALVDRQKWTFIFDLDEDNNINGCTISMRQQNVDNARTIFQEAWGAGKDFVN